MNPFTRFAFFTLARDAGYVALAGVTLMVGFSPEPALALKIGATVALIFAIGLLVRAYFLTDERLERSEVWRALPDEERPPGDDGRRWARGYLQGLLLRAAKTASGCAGVLYGSALVVALAASLAHPPTPSAHHFVNAEAGLIAIN